MTTMTTIMTMDQKMKTDDGADEDERGEKKKKENEKCKWTQRLFFQTLKSKKFKVDEGK